MAGSVQQQWGSPNFANNLEFQFSKKSQNKTTSGFRLLKLIKELVPGGWFLGKETRRLGCWVSVGLLTSSMIL
jgi:hypothetical protein